MFVLVFSIFSLLSFCRVFRQGMHDLRVWQKMEGDGSDPTSTPGKASGKHDKISRLDKVLKCSAISILFSWHHFFFRTVEPKTRGRTLAKSGLAWQIDLPWDSHVDWAAQKRIQILVSDDWVPSCQCWWHWLLHCVFWKGNGHWLKFYNHNNIILVNL